MTPRFALLSVHDKRGIVPFARGLLARGFSLLSTGGTHAVLDEAGLPVRAVSDHTGAPELFDGRVKTLHPRIHGGILAREGVDDADADAHGIARIDVVAVNLYPFARTVVSGASASACVEQIDVGGPAMVRAAAKNADRVYAVVDPADYDAVLADLDAGGSDGRLRRVLAARAFAHTAAYDADVAAWMLGRIGEESLPARRVEVWERVQTLRYGENPHQRAAFYARAGDFSGTRSLAHATQVQGKELSYNNLADLDAAVWLAFDVEAPCAVVVKHTNPCGAAVHPGIGEAFRLALSADPVSAYGGILAFNRPLDGALARTILESRTFFEAIAAPGVEADARALLAPRANLRVLELPRDWASRLPDGQHARRVQGGWLVQDWDVSSDAAWVSAGRVPSPTEADVLRFAWTVARRVSSNAIVLATHDAGGVVLNGVGAGQTSRVDAVRVALAGARRPIEGSVLASDAFFPFPDGVEVALAAGIRAFVQPGGSVRDDAVLAVARAADAVMELTGARHFRH